MAATNRKAHWERIYTTSDPTEVGWYQPDPSTSLRLIDALELARDS